MQVFKAVLVFLMLVCTARAQDVDVIRRADSGVFRILNPSNLATGTGFLIRDDGYMMTNQHVIDGASFVYVLHRSGDGNRAVKAKIISASKGYDMALLKVDGLPGRPLRLNVSPPPKGQKVFALGFPGVADMRKARTIEGLVNIIRNDTNYTSSSHTTGDISRVVRESWEDRQGQLSIIQHTAPVRGGNSGGPLLDLCGDVVGINTAIKSDVGVVTVHLATASREIADFLERSNLKMRAVSSTCSPGKPASAVTTTRREDSGNMTRWLIAAAALVTVALGFGIFWRWHLARGRSAKPNDKRPERPGFDADIPASVAVADESAWRLKFFGETQKKGIRFTMQQIRSGLVIGRDSSADFTLAEPGISRRHARLVPDGSRLMLEDLGSTNGTSVNGKSLREGARVALSHGDEIALGRTRGTLEKE